MEIGGLIYHSKRTSEHNATIPSFSAPTQYRTRFNYITVASAAYKGYIEIMRYGETINDTWVLQCNTLFFRNVFSEGDLLWVDGETPDDSIEAEYGNGASANAVVDNVAYGNRYIQITLKTNKNRVVV